MGIYGYPYFLSPTTKPKIMLNITPKSLSLTLLFIAFLVSCNNSAYIVQNDGNPSIDSLRLVRCDTILTLNIGDSIIPNPNSSQIINIDSKELYAFLDAPKIYIFDLEQDSLLNSIDASVAGKLLNYSGFTYVNDDSIFVYDYGKSKKLSLINNHGLLLDSYPLTVGEGQVSPETFTSSPILIHNGRAVICGTPMSSKSKMSKDDPIGVTIRLSDNKQTLGGAYSNEYEGLLRWTIHEFYK